MKGDNNMNNYYRNNYNKSYNCMNYYNMQHNRMNPNYIKDYGPEPIALNIEEITKQNNTYRTALWTGEHLQVTVMSIGVGDDIGLEVHPDTDQFIRVEDGVGVVKMGNNKDNLTYQKEINKDYAFIVPAGTWHNLVNVGNVPLKLYSIYAPPHHEKGTVQNTKADEEH
jgi:mannose-6-phosphate isomerase-like protein (cupin superfamily)